MHVFICVYLHVHVFSIQFFFAFSFFENFIFQSTTFLFSVSFFQRMLSLLWYLLYCKRYSQGLVCVCVWGLDLQFYSFIYISLLWQWHLEIELFSNLIKFTLSSSFLDFHLSSSFSTFFFLITFFKFVFFFFSTPIHSSMQ